MATDNTHLTQSEDAAGSTSHEFNPEVIQVAEADTNGAAQPNGNATQAAPIPGVPNGEVQVQVPAGQTVVRVQVAPGETIDLPFDGGMAAKFGQQGNLAIKVGDQTIILLGYAEANQQAGVTVKDGHGHPVDVASVVAATDPNLDIQTAAGPAAGPASQGGHLFFDFNPGAGLGGFGELNVIDPTQLQYGLIQPDEKILVIGEAPTYSITFDITGGTVNEDDLTHSHFTHHGETEGTFGVQVETLYSGSENPASAGLQDQLNAFFNTYGFKSHEGNDPFDTDDHEAGSQNNPPLSDDNNGIDQDREPVSSTAHVAVNFHNASGGTLTFDHNGNTPVITQLVADGLTSHGHALSYALLPATGTHGESVVAYYEQNGVDVVVFSLEIQQSASTTAQGNFDVTYTIYGPIDNVGANAAEFDLPTTFFLNANGTGLFTESAGTDLVFRDIDDVPELGHYTYGYQESGDGEGSGSPTTSTDTAVYYNPANLTIGIDESHGVQHTQYNVDLNVLDPKNASDPANSLHQSQTQTTDDISGSHAWHIAQHAETAINTILHGDSSDPQVSYQQGILSNLSSEYVNEGGFCAKPLGVATMSLDVSFGADGGAGDWVNGKFVGDADAGKTLFDKDGDANATAFQLYMQDGGTATGVPDATTPIAPKDMVETNTTINVDDGNGGYITEHVYAYQLDANTIIGIAYPDGQVPGDGSTPPVQTDSVTEGGSGTPVFELYLDPQTGELSLIQYHSVVNPAVDGVNGPNDPLNIETVDGQQLFYFRATDYDGDYVDAPLGVAIIDDAPKLTCSDVSGVVAESALWDGNRDNPWQSTVATGSLSSTVDFGVDQSGHFAINLSTTALAALQAQHLTSDGQALHYMVQNGELIGYTGSSAHPHDVFTLSVDQNGNYTFTLEGNLDHQYDHNTQSLLPIDLSSVITATDSDGDSVVLNNGQFEIKVQDDVPVATCRTVDGTVDESALYDGNRESFWQTTHASGNLSGTVDFGADHHGTFSIDANALQSLQQQHLTSNGQTLHYMVQNGELVGYTGSSQHPHDVFTLSVDQNGNYKFTLLDNIDHVGQGNNNTIDIDFSGVIKATDSDGDSIHLNNGQFEINVNDDQPVSTCRSVDGTVDESALYDGNRENFWQTTHASGNLSGTVDFGADHNGSFSIDANALQSLINQHLTSNGQSLHYEVDHGQLVGYVFDSHGHEHEVFTLSVDSNGNYNFTLLDNIDHVGQGNNNTIDIDFSGVIKATDGDGDSIHLNNGQFEINVNDDQPVSTCRTVDGTVDESALYDGNRENFWQTTIAQGNLSSTVDFGADHNGTFSIALNTNTVESLLHQHLTSNGQALQYDVENGKLVGYVTDSHGHEHDVFTLSVDQNGNYKFTLLDNIDHVGQGNNNTIDIDFSGVIKATDGDGDSIYLNNGQFEINVNDDQPVATICTVDGTVDESALSDGNRENSHQTTVAHGNLGSTVDFGADHNGTFSIDANALQSLTNQHLTSNGQALHYMVLQNGDLLGYTGSSSHPHSVFTLSVDSNGNYNFTLQDNIDHVGKGNDNTIDIDFSGVIKATDGDGDSIHLNNGQFEINVNDDQPVATICTVDGTVDESALNDGNREGFWQTTHASGNLSSTVDFGADSNGTFSIALSSTTLASLTSQNLTSNGQTLHYEIDNGKLVGFTTDSHGHEHDVFTLSVSQNGNYTFTLLDNLDHTGQGQGDAINIDFSGVIKATDGDGDSINLNSGQFDITVKDDQPVATVCTVDGVVDESALYDGNRENNAQTTIAHGNLAGEVSFGADHHGTFSLDLANSTLDSQHLTSDGQPLHYMIQGNELIGYTGDAANPHDVFTLTVASNGDYQFTLLDDLDHVGTGQGDAINIDFSSVVKATDSDGDSINLNSGQFDITVNDDQPVATQNTVSASVDESALFQLFAGPYGNRDNLSQTTVAHGSLSGDVSFGADHNGTFSIALSSTALQNLESQNLTSGGQALEYTTNSSGELVGYTTDSHGHEHDVFTLSVTSSGNYTFTLLDNLDHPADGNTQSALPIDLSSVITATDGDGDSIQLNNGQFVVNVNDDVPTLLALPGLGSVTIDETPGPQLGTNDHFGGTNPFAGVIDGTPLEWGSSLLPVVGEIVSFGADGPAASNALTFALQITNTVSGLHDTATGDAIILSQLPDGTVVGRIDDGNGDSSPIAIAFKVNGDGTLTVAEYRAIEHPNTSSPNDSVSLPGGVLSVVVTATDGDHDSVQQSVDIGQKITIKDDGPTVSVSLSSAAEPVLETYDHDTINGGQGTSSANFASMFTVTPGYGVDLPGHTTTAYTLTLLGSTNSGMSSDGNAITLSISADHSTVTGTANGQVVFTLSVDSTGQVTLTQYHEIDHLPSDAASSNYDSQILALASHLVGVTATATATDGDGDTATASKTVDLGGHVEFADDGPSVSVTLSDATEPTLLTHDHATIAGGHETVTADFSTMFTVTESMGADTPGTTTTTYGLTLLGSTDSGLTSGGEHIILSLSADGSTVTGTTTGGETVFTLSVDGSGEVSLTQDHAIDHLPSDGASSNYDSQILSLAGGLVGVTATVTATDYDGDTASGHQTVDLGGHVSFADDGPTGISAVALTVDEDALTAAQGHLGSPGIEGGPNDIDGGAGTATTVSTTSLAGINFGADGEGDVKIDTTTLPNLTSDGHTVQYSLSADGHTLTGFIVYDSADNQISDTVNIFTLQVDPANLTTTFTLLGPIDHSDPGYGTSTTTDNEDNSVLSFNYIATDSDGDHAGGAINVTVNDDSPVANCVSGSTTEVGSNPGQQTVAYELDTTNYDGSTGNSHVLISAGFVDANGNLVPSMNGDTPAINTNPDSGGVYNTDGFGVSSASDGGNGDRYDEVNYLGDGLHGADVPSEAMIFKLADAGKAAVSATVNVSEFYSNEGGVGDERGAYMLYRDGVPVSGWVMFEANSSNGHETLNITGPAGGFDQIVFIGVQGSANPNGDAGSDSSDYSVHDVTFNVVDTPPVAHVAGDLNFAFGADGPGSVFLNNTGPTNLTYHGQTITNEIDNGILVGKAADGTVVYSLTISHDQNGYHYAFDQSQPIDQLAANNGQDVSQALDFSYGVRDNDGDTTSACITITLSNHGVTVTEPVTATGADTVYEQGLPNGSDAGDGSNSCHGAIQVTAPDGVTTITINGTPVSLDTTNWHNTDITTPDGTLSITNWNPSTGELDYTYTLQHNTSGDTTTDSFSVVVTDSQGDHNPASSLVISIVDDVPTAHDDANSVNSGDTLNVAGSGVEGNDVFGADGKDSAGGVVGVATGQDASNAVSGNVGGDLVGSFGTLHLNSDGSYTYTANPNTSGVDHFVYTIKDGDGDMSTAHLDITVNPASVPAITSGVIADESLIQPSDGQPAGSHWTTGADTVDGSIATDLTADGLTVAAQSLTGHFGTLQVNADGSYTYTLTKADTTTPAANDGANILTGAESFTIETTDSHGNHGTATITVDIKDDTPTATDDGNYTVSSLNQNSTPEISHDASTGLLSNDHLGADGGSITSVSFDGHEHAVGTAFAVDGGELTVNADGSWSYDQTSPLTSAQTDTFTYTVTDGDGDKTTATFSINPLVNNNTPHATDDHATVPVSTQGVSANYNVLLVVDMSLSMADTVSQGHTRLDVELAALEDLVSKYQALADGGAHVNVQIETFDTTDHYNGTTYSSDSSATTGSTQSLDSAISYLQSLNHTNNLAAGTNYDAAIGGTGSDSDASGGASAIISHWPQAGGTTTNTVYFVSDGDPQSGSGIDDKAGNGYLINQTQQNAWQALLDAKNASAYAIGVDLGNNPNLTYLSQVADSTAHVLTSTSINLTDTLATILPVTNTVSGNLLYNDQDGGDGYHPTNPVLSIDVDGHTYALTALQSGPLPSGVTHGTGDTYSFATEAGGVLTLNFDTGDYGYTAPTTVPSQPEAFQYMIGDSNGDTAQATLTIEVTANSPVAYDNANEALVTTTTTQPTTSSSTLADFHTTSNPASNGPNYNAWIFDTKDDSNPSGNETTVQSITGITSSALTGLMSSNGLDHWGVHSASGSGTGDVTVTSGGALQITDGNGSSSGDASVVTPEFTIGAGDPTTLSFQVMSLSNLHNTGNNHDAVTWTLYVQNGSTWTATTQTGTITGTGTITTDALAAGNYRLVVNVHDSSNGGNLSVSIDNIQTNTTHPGSQQPNFVPATGNVITDPMNNPLSLDPWNGVDIATEAAVMAVAVDGGAFTAVAAGAAGTTVTDADGGSLTIHQDGSYTYTPVSGDLNHTHTFTYELSDGTHVDTASLTISTDGSAASATQVHTLADTGVTYTAASGDQVIIGGAGDDHITGNSTSHHLEGGAGNDHLIGGSGNDFLIGGDGNDILEGGLGHNQYSGGAGNDTIIIANGSTDLSDSAAAPRHIDGGSGIDTLDLSHLASADLSGANHTGITSIEAISLSGGASSGTTLTLDPSSVLDMSSNHELVITGDNNDKVNLNGSAGTWTAGETGLTVAGDTTHTYDAYNASVGGSHVTVLVEHETNVQVQLNHS